MAVRMRHEGVEQDIEVPGISVPVYERSGWTVVDDGQAVETEETKAAAKGRRRSEGES